MRAGLYWSVLIAAMVPDMASAQAFGVQPGDPVSKHAGKRYEDSATLYEVSVPNPNPEFDLYMATAAPGVGICRVVGLGKTYENDEYGTSARAAYRRLKSALAARYGNSKEFDFLRAGAIWDEPREWVWSVYKKERSLSSFWDSQEGSNLPAGLTSVTLQTKSVNPSSGAYLTVTYEFDNLDRCDAVKDKADQRGL